MLNIRSKFRATLHSFYLDDNAVKSSGKAPRYLLSFFSDGTQQYPRAGIPRERYPFPPPHLRRRPPPWTPPGTKKVPDSEKNGTITRFFCPIRAPIGFSNVGEQKMSYWMQLEGRSQAGSWYTGPDRKEPPFSGPASDGAPHSPVGELLHSGGSPVVAAHPDPLFREILQEFSIKQGVGGSGSGPVWGSVPENPYNGARSVAGLGVGRDGKMGVWGWGSYGVGLRSGGG